MKRPTMGGVYLLGRDRDVWSNPKQADLVTLQARVKNDLLSSWVDLQVSSECRPALQGKIDTAFV